MLLIDQIGEAISIIPMSYNEKGYLQLPYRNYTGIYSL